MNICGTYFGEITSISRYPSLSQALAEALVDLIRFIEGADDGEMDADDAVKALEGVSAVAVGMSDSQRAEFLEVLGVIATAEAASGRREFLGDVLRRFWARGSGLVRPIMNVGRVLS